MKARLLSTFEELLSEYRSSPSFWAEEIRACIDRLHHSLPERLYVAPSELQSFGLPEGWRFFSKILTSYGELLEIWPDLMQVSRELREQGIRSVRPLKMS